MRSLALVATVLGFAFSGTAQSNPRPIEVCALGRAYCDPDSCELEVMRRYGIVVTHMGCLVTNEKLRTNRRACRKLKRRVGHDWQDRFAAELNTSCGSERCRLHFYEPVEQ